MRPSAAAVAVTACLLLATALAAWFGARQVERRADEQLDERATAVAATIERRLDTYLEKTFGIRGLVVLEGEPTRRQIERFLAQQRIEARFPGALALGIAEVTTLRDRRAFVRRVREDARRSGLPYPPFRVRPNDDRAFSVVVDSTHPVEGLEAAFGFDLMSEATRRAAVLRARARAAPSASAPVRFVTERGDERGILVMLPMYRGTDQMPPAAERTRRFRGVAYAALRLPDLLRGLAAPGDDLEIYDVGSVDDPVPARVRAGAEAFDLRGGPDAPSREASDSRLIPLVVAGRRWQVYVRPAGPLVSAAERAIPWLIAGLGTIVSLLAGGVVQALVTSTRRAEALAERRTDELRRSNEELERFAFLASHDLQQPLRTISGFLQLLERQAAGRLTGRDREYIDQALRGSRQMSGLIDDLLAYSRVSRDDRPLRPVPLDDAWDAAVEQLRATIDGAQARVTRDALPVVPGDPGQLVQVFANLIGNAVKYRGEALPRIHAGARRVNGGWEIAVEDNGIGIDPRDHERIFEMFRRLHTDGDVEGTGVGLALAKRIVERSGGDMRVESEPGAGSRFIVSMPAADPTGAAS
jgi:signal transduction histidine kinase